ncbi:MAG TPA: hypothetical protein VF181_05025 [Balneolaceae bacterium]
MKPRISADERGSISHRRSIGAQMSIDCVAPRNVGMPVGIELDIFEQARKSPPSKGVRGMIRQQILNSWFFGKDAKR